MNSSVGSKAEKISAVTWPKVISKTGFLLPSPLLNEPLTLAVQRVIISYSTVARAELHLILVPETSKK